MNKTDKNTDGFIKIDRFVVKKPDAKKMKQRIIAGYPLPNFNESGYVLVGALKPNENLDSFIKRQNTK